MINQLLFLVACLFFVVANANAQNKTTGDKNYFTIENYYKVKGGYSDEFISLWKKNHYPLLKKLVEKGDVISISATAPQLHSSEESRWDFDGQ